LNGGYAERVISRSHLVTACLTLFLVLAAALAAAPALAKPRPSKSLTVDRIFSGPSLSGYLTRGIEWSPDGKRISYLERDGSSVQMWTMDAAKGDRKILVNANVLHDVMQPRRNSAIQSTGLGRVEAENYLWSPSGDALLFIGSSNLVLLDLKTMASKPLASAADSAAQDIADPKFSPDGKWVSFVRDSNLWVASVATGDARPLTIGSIPKSLIAPRLTGGRPIPRKSPITKWTSARSRAIPSWT
jgi:dipeptidyl-peptidase 4